MASVEHARQVHVVDVLGLAKSMQTAIRPLGALPNRRRLLPGFRHQYFERHGYQWR
jgi:hypothetical protein